MFNKKGRKPRVQNVDLKKIRWVYKRSNDDFITGEYKKTRVRGEISHYNYDAQKTGKGFKMNAHHVPLRQMNHRYEQSQPAEMYVFFWPFFFLSFSCCVFFRFHSRTSCSTQMSHFQRTFCPGSQLITQKGVLTLHSYCSSILALKFVVYANCIFRAIFGQGKLLPSGFGVSRRSISSPACGCKWRCRGGVYWRADVSGEQAWICLQEWAARTGILQGQRSPIPRARVHSAVYAPSSAAPRDN